MTFYIRKKWQNQFTKLANHYLDNAEKIERIDNDSLVIWGSDPTLGTASAVGVDINKKGKITSIFSFTVGEDVNRDWDNQLYVFDVKKPKKTINKLLEVEISDTPIYADMTNPQPFADAFNDFLPGLSGGPTDVYVAFGEYSAFA